jgi:FSR family fosmidomycin resistance protein-like MFS transporter
VLTGISFSHFLNDTMQSLIASVYPILKDAYALDYGQIGMITLAFQFTASLLQPVVGHFTDKKAQPFSLAIGMGFTFFGLLLLSVAARYPVILIAAALVGLGSAVFHPESARIARLASGGRYGFAQSVFQLGGSFGTSMGPVLAALIVVPFGQPSIAWFSSIAFLAIVILWRIGVWYKPQIATKKSVAVERHPDHPDSRRVKIALAVLVALLFSKQLYVSSLSSYYIFYLIDSFRCRRRRPSSISSSSWPPTRRGVLRRAARRSLRPQIRPLVLDPRRAAVHAGAALCRPCRKRRADGFHRPDPLVGDVSIIVFAQELMPHRFGMISGVFFGRSPSASAGLAPRARQARRSHRHRLRLSPLRVPAALGLLAVFLPEDAEALSLSTHRQRRAASATINKTLTPVIAKRVVRQCLC